MPIGAVIGAVGSVAGGLLGASAANKAARAQKDASQAQVDLTREQYNTTRNDLAQFRDAGGLGTKAYLYELGLGSAPSVGDSTYGGYQEAPGTQYLLQKGADSVNALAGSRGGLDSGATRQALQENAMGVASQGYNTYLNRLAGLSDMGANAAGMNATNSANYVANASNALSNYGNAASAGYIGSANAINQGIGNAISSYGYLSNARQPQPYSNGTAGQGIW